MSDSGPHLSHVSFALGEVIYESGGRLQESGLISYVRGRITILDRRGLEAAVCECHKVVKDEYDRLLG